MVVPEFFGVIDKARNNTLVPTFEAITKAIDLPQSADLLPVGVCQPDAGQGRTMDWTILTVLPAIMVLGLALIASRPSSTSSSPGHRISKRFPTLR